MMKRITMILACLVGICFGAMAENIEVATSDSITVSQFDLRNIRWGMSVDEVKASEPEKPVFEQKEVLTYKINIAGFNTNLFYVFIENKLYNAGYSFLTEHTNKNDYVGDYENLKKILDEKYGSEKSSILWKNNLYKNDSNYIGMAISSGHVVYSTLWNTDKTKITLSLRGDNFKVKLNIFYDSNDKELLSLVENKNKAEKSKGF